MSLLALKKALMVTRLRYVQQTSDTLPAMTDNTAPAGHVASVSGGGDSLAWRMFDKVNNNPYASAITTTAGWWQRKTPSAIRLWRFGLTGRGDPTNQCPKDFALKASNDGSTWVTLASVSGQTDWSPYETRYFVIPPANRGAYTFHRLEFTTNNGSSNSALCEIMFNQEVRR